MAKSISQKIQDELDRVGIFHRTFYRCKSEESLESKLVQKEYDGKETFLRDVIGFRTNLYFADDVEIVYPYIKGYFDFVEETRDINFETEFKPTRLNLIFRLPDEFKKEFDDLISDSRIDNTFEFQLRTVLSEGWHEVDHDLRYKCKSDWDSNGDLGRMLNGVLAALEASDWTTIQIFQNLSYRHYRMNNIESMLRSKFRMRFGHSSLDDSIESIINSDEEMKKSVYKIERNEFIMKFLDSGIIMPINLNNLIFLLNYWYLKEEKIFEVMPDHLKREFDLIGE
ncbi:MAG: RelA/SpoT domain-containing protein [Chitinophagales bacterium]|nr:RelA/SpoT domain-containing protein [Chitinophagales bacterium]